MAKVSLRIYNREIESLIDHGQNDEATAHCLHILKTFPKHLETYRLLGKSFLEAKKYNEAVDIFSRLLVCVPDDFVANVGMSIINDEQNKLDNAIWHMERAFESQPSNAAIQGELQRLYGRRDGMEPPKIRMTRGSLAYMYVQGELYAQAISEIRGVLATDPKRIDMQALLAKALFKSGQKADASDMCNQLLKTSPYSLEANRIMVELIPITTGAESTQAYRARLIDLDPYVAFAQGSVYRANEVPDASINLDHLAYKPEEDAPMAPDWGTSLGLALAPTTTSTNDQPDWLKSSPADSVSDFGAFAFDDTPASPPEPAPTKSAGDNIPEFLRAAGWGDSSGAPEQAYSLGEIESTSAGALAPAEVPDWMKAMAPSTQESTPAVADSTDDGSAWLVGLEAAAANATGNSIPNLFDEPVSFNNNPQNNTPDWLSSSSSPSTAPQQIDNTPDWLSSLGGNDAPAQSASVSDSPDWLSNLGGSEPSAPAQPASTSDTPDWLSGIDNVAASAQATAALGDMPDWLGNSSSASSQPTASSTIPSADEQDDAVAWLESLASKHGAKPEELVTDPNRRSDVAPTWVEQSKTPAAPQQSASTIPSADEQDDAVAWLESLASKHGAKPEELVTDPNRRSDIAPTWVEQSKTPAAPQPQQSASTIPSADEQDDAVAWLESLASKHGAKPEELVTDPNRRSDVAPTWVEQSKTPAAAQPQQSASTIPSADEQDDAVAWLESLASKHGAKPEELVTDPNRRSDVAPTWVEQSKTPAAPAMDTTGAWLLSLDDDKKPETKQPAKEWSPEAQNIGEQFMAEFDKPETPAAPAMDTTGAWLRSLGDDKKPEPKQPAKEWSPEAQNIGEQFMAEFDKPETPPAPSWLKSLEEEKPESKQPVEWSAQAKNIGEQFMAEFESGDTDDPITDKSVTDWLAGLDDDIVSAVPTKKPSLDKLDEWAPIATTRPEPVYVDDPFDNEPTPAPSSKSNDIPDWMKDASANNKKTAQANADDDLPEWLKGSSPDPEPTNPTDWKPLESKPVTTPAASTPKPVPASAPKPMPTPVPIDEPVETETALEEESTPSPRAKSIAPARAPKQAATKQAAPKPEKSSPQVGAVLGQAQSELSRGDIPEAVNHYQKLIKKGKNLDEAIHDLRDALYRYPVEVSIWQTLGDAYMRANRLQEALDAYTKAEELLR